MKRNNNTARSIAPGGVLSASYGIERVYAIRHLI